jgi:hypothetical protein
MKTKKPLQLLILYFTVLMFNPFVMYAQLASQDSSEISVPEYILRSYVGRYDYSRYGQGLITIVTLEGNQLFVQHTGQSKVPIFPSSENEFYTKVVTATIKFVADEKGNITHLVHYQNGMKFEAPKLPDEQPVEVDPSIFDKYVGKYDIGSSDIVYISKEDNKLFVQGANLPAYQLLPASDTEYFLREANARVTFNVGEDGMIDSAVINLSGNVITAVKIQ